MFSFRLKQVPIIRRRHLDATPGEEAANQGEASELVWNFLLKNQDRFAGEDADATGVAVVSHLRQEEIADRVGMPLHVVIEALQHLMREDRLQVVSQGAGNPNRYTLRKRSTRGQTRIAL